MVGRAEVLVAKRLDLPFDHSLERPQQETHLNSYADVFLRDGDGAGHARPSKLEVVSAPRVGSSVLLLQTLGDVFSQAPGLRETQPVLSPNADHGSSPPKVPSRRAPSS